MRFKVLVQNLSGSEQWDLPFDSFSFTEELNNDRSAKVSFNRQVIEAVASSAKTTIANIFHIGYRELYIYNDDGDILYSGFIDTFQTSGGKDEAGTINITSRGFFSLLQKRFTDALRTYSSEDSSDIAWDLIDYTQGLTYGDLGITRGNNPTTKDRDRTLRYAEIADTIKGMSANDTKEGYDFEVNNSKVFNVYYPEMGTKRHNIILEHGFNVETYQVTQNGLMNLVNEIFVFGEGYGDDALVVNRDAENIYKNNYGLLQETLSEKDIITTDTLNDKGDKQLDERKFPRKTIAVTVRIDLPEFTNYSLGDRIKIVIAQENVNDFYRVIKRTVQDSEIVNLTLYPV